MILPTTSGNFSPNVEGITEPGNFTEYATSTNSSQGLTFTNSSPGRAYVDVPPYWQTNFLNLTVNELSENRTWTENTHFNSGTNGWTYSNQTYYYPYWNRIFERPIGGWVNNTSTVEENCTYVILNGTWNSSSGGRYYYVSGQEGRWTQQLVIPRGEVLYASVECDLFIEYAFIEPAFEIFFMMDGNDIPDQVLALTDFRDLQDFIPGEWFHVRFEVDPSKFDLVSNNTLYFSYGLSYFRSGYVIAGLSGPNAENQTVYFDNVNLNIVTRAYSSDVNLTATVNGDRKNLSDLDWSQGNCSWTLLFPSAVTQEITSIEVLFETNCTDGLLDWTIIASGSKTTLVTYQPVDPYLGIGESYKGFSYTTNSTGPVEWEFYFYNTVPLGWNNQYRIAMNISRDWTITSIRNPNFIEVVEHLLGGHSGDGYFGINPDNASTPGFWQVEAQSINYNICPIMGGLQPDSIYTINMPLQVAVNVTQTTGFPENLITSVGNLSLYHPNGTLFWETSVTPDSQAIITFPTIVIGAVNTSAGRYTVHYSWTNGTAVAFNSTYIIVQHTAQFTLILPSNYDPGTPLQSIYGSTLALRVELWDTDANRLVGNTNVTLIVNGHSYRFNEVSEGVYDLNFDSQALGQSGIYDCSIHVDGVGVNSNDFSLKVDLFVPQTMTWVLISVIAALAASITAILVWTKVVIPRRKRAYDDLMELTSHYYDAHALVGYIVLYKRDGVAIFDQWQDMAEKRVDANLISGFLTAITAFGEQLPVTKGFDDLRSKKKQADTNGGKFRIMSLDYQDFVILLLDGRFIRVATIFATKPSVYFETRLRQFAEEFEDLYEMFLTTFAGSIDAFQKADGLFNKYLHFHMTRPIALAQSTKAKKAQKNVELTDSEQRMMNVIQTFLREKDYVRLRTVASLYATAPKDQELTAVKGIVGLWLKGMLTPVDPEESLETALRFFSQEDAEILTVIANGTLNHDLIATEVKLSRNAVDAKLQSFRAWKLINMRDQISEKGRILLERRLANKV